MERLRWRAAADVVVGGAGPTGLMVAGELALAGVAVAVVARHATPSGQSRGGGVNPRTSEVLAMRGLLDAVTARAIPRESAGGHFAGLPVPLDARPWRTCYPNGSLHPAGPARGGSRGSPAGTPANTAGLPSLRRVDLWCSALPPRGITLIRTGLPTVTGLVELVVEQLTVTAARQSFGKQLAGLRCAANLTQCEFAQLVGYSRSTVANIELGRQHPSPIFCRKSDEVLSTGGVFRAALDELEELRRESHRKAAASALDERRKQSEQLRQEQERTTISTAGAATVAARQPLPGQLFGAQPQSEEMHGCGTNRRNILNAIGAGAVLSPLAGQGAGVRELVLNAAHSSALLLSAIDTPKIEDRTLNEARQDLNRLATDYVANLELTHTLPELVILRDRLYTLLAWYGQRPSDARELHLLLGATCVLLASISLELAEPGAAMTQTRTALAFAELAGHAGLITWVYCTRASIASWSGSADDVLHHTQRARAAGLSGIGAVRLAGLEARALAQSGRHQQVVEVLHAAHTQHDKLSSIDSLRDLGEFFTFSAARQHYYNAAAFTHVCDWDTVEREASRVISLYGAPETGQCWPVTMTLSQVHLAQARLSLSGPEGAQEALTPVFAIPDELRVPQVIKTLSGISIQLSSKVFAKLPAAQDLDEAIRNFCPAADNQERP